MSRFRSASASSSALIAIALAAIAFAATGGTEPGRTGPTEVVVLLVAGVLVVAALLVDADSRPYYGGGALVLFTLLVVITGLSMSWSIASDLTLQELGRSLTYLAVFGVGLIGARQFPLGGRRLLLGVTGAVLIVCGWALLTRMLPGQLAESVFVPRLGAPFDYWNALGGFAAMGVPGCLWLAARREGGRASTAAAYPALTGLTITVLLTQSRGALAAAVIAGLLWLAVVPLRLRTVPVLIAAAIGAIPATVWALSQDAFTRTAMLADRKDAAAPFALFVVVTLVVVAGIGWLVVTRRESFRLEAARRLQVGRALVGVLAVLIVAGIVAAATTGGGLSGRLDSLTSSQATVEGGGAARLGSTSSSRGKYWRQAVDVFKEAPFVGRGADGFSLASLPYRKDLVGGTHAHSWVMQTLADLGLIGLAVGLALLAAWLAAARRTLDVPLRRDAPPVEWTADRTALVALTAAVVAYGVQSLIDWTWFIPGVTATVMAAAGFLAGRGPVPEGAPARRPIRGDALRVVGAAAVAVVFLLSAWAVWQPERGTAATDRAVELSDQGRFPQALAEVRRARSIDPYSADPLFTESLVRQAAGQRVLAYRALEQAVAEHPRDPETWLQLSQYELGTFDLPQRALASATAAASLDPQAARTRSAVLAAQQAIQADQAALNPVPAPAPTPAPAPQPKKP